MNDRSDTLLQQLLAASLTGLVVSFFTSWLFYEVHGCGEKLVDNTIYPITRTDKKVRARELMYWDNEQGTYAIAVNNIDVIFVDSLIQAGDTVANPEGKEYVVLPDVNIKVIRSITDERGLISVVFIQASDTFALDYLTKREFDSLISK